MFQHAQLANGLTVIAESSPPAQSVAVGFFVKTGSRDETPEVAGVSHFLEHMAFKGDDRYTADDVNRIFDEVGANYNASTGEEVTCFYAAILPEYLPQTFQLLATLIRPSLRTEDFDIEKQVILEEIGMYQDLPAFHLYEQAMSIHFAGHPLGNSILGSVDSITRLTADQMRAYHAQQYFAGNIVLAATGRIDWQTLLELAERHCGDWPAGAAPRETTEARPGEQSIWLPRPELRQQHVMQMSLAPPAESDERFAADLISILLGDDSSGRLYWELVDPGDAESADLSYNDYHGSGAWSTYLCCSPELTERNLQRINALCDEFNHAGPTVEELERARNKVSSRVVLGSERPMGRLTALGGNWIYRGDYRSVADDLNTLQQLSLADLQQTLERYPIGPLTTVGLGPITTG
ncbi:MAG: insulinase family protein [Planctomycetaceae bacterium]|nr:insulinase family protein [Planctomycetaceae bacterium]